MKITLKVLIFNTSILQYFNTSILIFGQNSTNKNSYKREIIDNSQCISTTIFLPDESDLMVATIDKNATVADKNPEHYYIKVSDKKNLEFLQLLSDNSILNKVFILNDDHIGGYKELNTGKIVNLDSVKCLFQMDFGSPCHNDNLFILILYKKIAEKIMVQLAQLFNQNDGLEKLSKQLKTN